MFCEYVERNDSISLLFIFSVPSCIAGIIILSCWVEMLKSKKGRSIIISHLSIFFFGSLYYPSRDGGMFNWGSGKLKKPILYFFLTPRITQGIMSCLVQMLKSQQTGNSSVLFRLLIYLSFFLPCFYRISKVVERRKVKSWNAEMSE